MLIETEKEQICMNQLVEKRTDILDVRGDIIVNDIKPDVLNIISTKGIVCVYKKEVLENKIRIDGSINTYIIYRADDENGSIRSLNTTLDFTHMSDVENAIPEMMLDENIKIKTLDCKILNGRKLSIETTLQIDINIYSNDSISIINNVNNVEDLQILNNNININALMGKGSTKVFAKDNITLDSTSELAEIMKVDLKILESPSKISYNKVIGKADVEIGIMYLNEDNTINTVSTTVPVMGFIDIENVNEDNMCDTKFKLSNLIIKPSNDQNLNSIYVEAEIELICCVYEERKIDLIEDLYSIDSDISFNEKEVNIMKDKNIIKDNCNIKETISIPEINNNKVYDVDIKTMLNTTNIQNNRVIYEGEVILEFLYESNNGMDKKIVNIPINFTISNEAIDKDTEISTMVNVITNNAVVLSDGNIDMNINLEFKVSLYKNRKLNIIDEIMVEETRNRDIYSMVIYFVKPGDTLWKIGKKFKSRVEDIAKINNIEDINRINVGQQLYIPKFIKKSITV